MSENWKEITATWKGGMSFVGENASGGTLQMGTPDDKPAINPMELLLLGLAGCTGMDIVSILKKKRVRLSAFKIKVTGRRAGTYPMIWTEILVDYLLWGEEIKPKDVEQAIRLSEKKYCSVSIMLGKSAKITSEYHILKPDESAG